jgi:serine/threonine-protein kinase
MNGLTQSSLAERLLASRILTAEQVESVRARAGKDERTLVQELLAAGLVTRFQLRQLRAGASNFHVGKYVVTDYLGRGGNGVVFRARHALLPQREVALKTLDARDLHLGSEVVARFQREIDIVTRLEHPNIVRAYDVIRTRTQVFLVLEYVDGRDLAAVVQQRGRLPAHEAVGYVIQAARGLGYAHRHGVVHRDLKPANLLLTRDGVVKLSDLGLARPTGGPAVELTLKGACLGTPEFMAPEQAEDATRADARSDIYSLGATLFHLLTAELPVTGSSQVHRLTRLLTVPPRPLTDVLPDAPPALAAVVNRLRDRDPAARPAGADEVISLLEPFARAGSAAALPWDARRKAALVLEVLQGGTTADEACRRHGLAAEEFERWRLRFLEGAERALDPLDLAGIDVAGMIRGLHARIGEQAMEIESLTRRLAGPPRQDRAASTPRVVT